MGMGGMIDFLFLASGIYLIYTAIMAKKRGTIAANVMLSKNANEKDIADKVGYIEYMYKKILLAGVMICIASVIHLANDYYIHSQPLTWVGIALIFAALAMYTAAFSRGQKKYMPRQKRQGKQEKQK
ncbi:MAG: hypothetical protein K2L82_14535 [Lachnospiraceae bacterium]|nr:hypothetical protein [Lachnospiraceae bacterium]